MIIDSGPSTPNRAISPIGMNTETTKNSGKLHGFHGLADVCLSLPRIVGRKGMEPPLPIPMTQDEESGLHASATRIQEALQSLKID